jgi:hypothetical protein
MLVLAVISLFVCTLPVWVEELFHGGKIETKAHWEGTIVADADTLTPMAEFHRPANFDADRWSHRRSSGWACQASERTVVALATWRVRNRRSFPAFA